MSGPRVLESQESDVEIFVVLPRAKKLRQGGFSQFGSPTKTFLKRTDTSPHSAASSPGRNLEVQFEVQPAGSEGDGPGGEAAKHSSRRREVCWRGLSEATRESSQLFGKNLVRKLMFPVVFAVVVYAALLFYGDAFQIRTGLEKLELKVVFWALAISTASFGVRALRWHYYLGTMKIRVPFADSMILFAAGLAMSITPGKAGEVLKSLLLKERYDVQVARSAPIIVAERATDLGALILLGGASALWNESPLLVGALGAALLGGLFAFGRSERLGRIAIDLLAIVPFLRRRRDKLVTAHASLRELWSLASFCVAIVLAIIAWTLQALTVTLFAGALEQHLLDVPDALIAYSAPLLAGTLAFLPGGLGLTEASMAGTLRALGEMSATTAATITILTRLVTFWLAIALGFCALGAWRLTRRALPVNA
jgi:glycosyltransferase 2 family protein